jgi:hypothetical protein
MEVRLQAVRGKELHTAADKRLLIDRLRYGGREGK